MNEQDVAEMTGTDENPATWKLKDPNINNEDRVMPVRPAPNYEFTKQGVWRDQQGNRMADLEARNATAVEQYMASNLGQRIAAKKQADSEGMVMGYTPEQQKKLDYYSRARDKMMEQQATGEITAQQAKQFDAYLTNQEMHILPQKMKRPPTIQEQIKSRTWRDPDTGQKYIINDKGMPELMKGLMSPKEQLELYQTIKTGLEKPILDKEGKETGEMTSADPEEIEAAYAAAIQTFVKINHITSGGDMPAPQGQPGQPPPPAGGTIGRRQPVVQQPQETQLPTWDELTPDQQTKAKEKYKLVEASQADRRGSFIAGGGSGITRKPINEQQWLDRVKKDPVYLGKFTGEIRKPGAPPPNWEKATIAERNTMYENYVASKEAGDDILSKSGFESKVRKDPSIIPEFLKSKGTKPQDKFKVGQTIQKGGVTWTYKGNNEWSDK